MSTATAENKIMYTVNAQNFSKVPGSPIAYWICINWYNVFDNNRTLRELFEMKKGSSTGNNDYFIKMWYEVSSEKMCVGAADPIKAQQSGKKWFPINSGGETRKWYGNRSYIVNWEKDGFEMKQNAIKLNHGGHWSRYIVSPDKFFKNNITWSAISSSNISVRYSGPGFAFSSAAMEIFGEELNYIIALINSIVAKDILKILAPTINFGVEQVGAIPLVQGRDLEVNPIVSSNIEISKLDWDCFETSWDFKKHPLT